MDIQKLSSPELLKLYYHPVKIIFVKDAFKNSPIVGNVYTIDPEHRTIGLVEFQDEKPVNFVLIPSSSIFLIEKNVNIQNNEITQCVTNVESYQPKKCTAVKVEKARAIFDQLFNFKSIQQLNENINDVNQRYKNLINVLQERKVEFKELIEDNQNFTKKTVLVGGVVRIIWPYTDDCLISTNQNALRKIKKLIESLNVL